MKKITFLFVALLSFSGWSQSTCQDALVISAGIYSIGVVNGDAPTLICAPNGVPTNTGNFAGMWYSYTPTQDYGVTVTTSLSVNQGRDSRFHVYTGTCGNLVCYAGDDDSGSGYLSEAVFNVTAGTTYTIVFDNRWGNNANNIDFQLIEGDVIVEPEPIDLLVTPVSFTTQTRTINGSYKLGLVDMNGDFLDDLVSVVSNNQVQIHYQNSDGTFTVANISTPTTENLPVWSMAAGDYDGNGYTDLLYGGSSGISFMKATDDGTGFEKISFPQYVFSQRSNFVDINNDGHLDAFVSHDVAPNVYYLNDGEGNLTFYQGGIGDVPSGGNYGSIWTDYDNDGNVDLFIAKCRGAGSPAAIDELHRGNGDGTYTNVAPQANINTVTQTWSAAWGDFDNDGHMDAVVGAYSFASGGHLVMRNNGDGTFTDITENSGFDAFEGIGVEYVAADFNNDGFIDVFCGGSSIIMYNNGDMTFSPVSAYASGALGDLNNDGFIDIMNGNNLRINDGNSNNWIKFNLQGVTSNRQGIGARIEIYGSWGVQIRDIRSGEGFKYAGSLNAHFGIGEATEIDNVIIRWPSGIVDTIDNPTINQPLFVLENSTMGVNENALSDFVAFPNPAKDVLTLNSQSSLTKAEMYDLSGRKVLTTEVAQNNTINISGLASGTYILLATDNSGNQSTQKIIKQ